MTDDSTSGFGFARDEATSALGRQATVFKKMKDWDSAIATLLAMQERMWVSPVLWGMDEWCRLALILQQAGRFEDSEREFEKLLQDIPRLARKSVHWNDPDIHFVNPGKLEMFKQRVEIYTQMVNQRRELSRSREARIVAKRSR